MSFKKIIAAIFFLGVSIFGICANEFVMPKKSKTKKELSAQVQQDIFDLFENLLRQLGKNIQQAVFVQNKLYTNMKKMFEHESQQSTTQLKQLRADLQEHLTRLEKQYDSIHSLLVSLENK